MLQVALLLSGFTAGVGENPLCLPFWKGEDSPAILP
jgi:hypothetical protein